MSLDLFFDVFRAGTPHPVPTAQLLAPFQPHVARTEPRCLVLDFGPGQESVLFLAHQAPQASGFTLNRPVPHPALYQALYHLLTGWAGAVLVVPDQVPPLLGRADSAPHLPADLVAALGAPRVVADAAEIHAWVAGLA